MEQDKISRHFTRSELACPCCGRLGMDKHKNKEFLTRLEELRYIFGRPMRISSGYRCPAHNSAVSHTGSSGPHTTGLAVDVLVAGTDAYDLVLLALQAGWTGIGVSQRGPWNKRFVHLDLLPLSAEDHPRPRLWSY